MRVISISMARTLTLVLLLAAGGMTVGAQTFPGMVPLAEYTMIGTAAERSGAEGDLKLTNTRYAGDSGIWANGIYVFDTIPGGSLVETPVITTMRAEDSLGLSMEIYVPRFDSALHPIIVAGGAWRYLGCAYGTDGLLYAVVNGTLLRTDSTYLTEGKWHTVSLSYTRGDSSVLLRLDDTIVFRRSTTLFAPADDQTVSNTHYGLGRTFLGYMRNMQIWGPDRPSSVDELQSLPPTLDLASRSGL